MRGPDKRPSSLFVYLLLVRSEVVGRVVLSRGGGGCCPDNTGGKILLIVRRD